MALWIESHAELGRHPKTARLAKLLKISKVCAVGHLHFLWWWCMDYAQDGDMARYTPDEIADGGMWEGDPEEFLTALVDARFVDAFGDGEGCAVHDWQDYGGKLLAKRRADAERKSTTRNKGQERTSDGHPTDIRVTAQVEETTTTTDYSTEEKKRLHRPADADAAPLSWQAGTSGGTPYVKQLREKEYTEPEIRWAIERYNLTPVPSKINGSPANYLAGMIREERKKGGGFKNGRCAEPTPIEYTKEYIDRLNGKIT